MYFIRFNDFMNIINIERQRANSARHPCLPRLAVKEAVNFLYEKPS
jgi:hypothetical protein